MRERIYEARRDRRRAFGLASISRTGCPALGAKCATGGNPAAHWAIRSSLEAVGAQWCAGCNSERCVQLACGRPRPIRFLITNTNPTPSSIRATELGSGVATEVSVKVPPAIAFGSVKSVKAEGEKVERVVGPMNSAKIAGPNWLKVTDGPAADQLPEVVVGGTTIPKRGEKRNPPPSHSTSTLVKAFVVF